MKKLKFYKGNLYESGFNGKRVLVIGHQKKNDDDPQKNIYKDECIKCRHCENVVGPCYSDNDNVSLMENLVEHAPWIDTHDGDSYRRFARMFTRNDSLSTDSEGWKDFWSKIAFLTIYKDMLLTKQVMMTHKNMKKCWVYVLSI